MLLFVTKRITPSPCFVIRSILTAHHNNGCYFSSSSPSATQNQGVKTTNFMVEYLISSFSFSPDQAARVSKRIAHVKSPEKPDSVIGFLSREGFTEADIKRLVTWLPSILCSSLEKTLEPNLRALREMGLSSSNLTQIILSCPQVLQTKTFVPRIKFWMDFFGGNEIDLVNASKKQSYFFAVQDSASKIALLESHGLSTKEIRGIVITDPRFITYSSQLIEEHLGRAKELGFQPGSPMFVSGLRAMLGNSREALKKKIECLKSFGWSENDFYSALRRSPNIVYVNELNLQRKIDFLMGEATFDVSYIKMHLGLLAYSLEKRLRPRHQVLNLLESKGLCRRQKVFISAMKMSDGKFVDSYILPYKEDISGLYEGYLAATT